MLYRMTPKVVVAHPFAAAILAFTFYEISSLNHLAIWLSSMALCIALRFAIYVEYQRKRDTMTYAQQIRWKHIWMVFSIINASIYTVALFYFVPLENPMFVMVSGLFTVALVAIGVITYAFSLSAVLSFAIPMLMPNAIYLLMYAGKPGVIAGSVICMFSFAMFGITKTISAAFKSSIRLNHEYSAEIEERKKIEFQLQEISRRDGLTGLFNRRYFDEILSQEIGRAYRNHSPLSLLMIDIDHFKEYNDFYGHVAGDNCLVDIAHLISSSLNRKGDLIARYGGEEFVCILPNIDSKGAFAYAEKLQMFIQEKRIEHFASKLTYLKSVTVSIGVTTLPMLSRLTATDLVQRADNALYQAKKQGRNRVKYYEDIDFDQDRV